MVIEVRKLNAQKKYTGHLSFEIEGDESLIDIPFVHFSTPIKVEADYELYEDDSLELKGKIYYGLVGQCSRCLKDAKAYIEGEIDAYFQPCKDAEDYSYSGGNIDLKEAVNDAVMSSMPCVLSCGENCEPIRYNN